MGANAPSVRARVLQDMGWCGLELDPDRNAGAVGAASRISPDGAAVEVYAIPPAEERYIARATYHLLTGDAE
jgi:acetate kinase